MPKLDWLTRPEDEKTAANVPYRLLEAVPELSYGDEQTENMLIQGNNLEALKALLPFYGGRVKCIYADPPFNTQQAFPDFDDNLEHSKWLSMMYPALEVQREMLSTDGTLFIHIDDNELGYLLTIADEIMGRKNRIAIVTFKQGAATGHKAINPGLVSVTNFFSSTPAINPIGSPGDCSPDEIAINATVSFFQIQMIHFETGNFSLWLKRSPLRSESRWPLLKRN